MSLKYSQIICEFIVLLNEDVRIKLLVDSFDASCTTEGNRQRRQGRGRRSEREEDLWCLEYVSTYTLSTAILL